MKALKERKINVGEKMSYLMEYEWRGNVVPGPGNYQPMNILPKLKTEKKNPKEWIAYHKNPPKVKKD